LDPPFEKFLYPPLPQTTKKIKNTSNQKKNIEEEQPKKKQRIESQTKKTVPKKKSQS